MRSDPIRGSALAALGTIALAVAGCGQAEQSASGKRVFRLTDAGREAAAAEPGKTPWKDVGGDVDDTLVALRDVAFQVMAATRQVAQAGTTAQVAAAQEILRTARKSLYRLLAEDDVDEQDRPD